MGPVPGPSAGRRELPLAAPATLPVTAAWPRLPSMRKPRADDAKVAAPATSEKKSLYRACPAGTAAQIPATPGTPLVASSHASPRSNARYPSRSAPPSTAEYARGQAFRRPVAALCIKLR